MSKAVYIFSNASLALLLMIAAAAVLGESWQLAALMALLAVDPLVDVARYAGGKVQRGFGAFLLELFSVGSAVVIMVMSMLYLSYTYLPLSLLLLMLATLDAAVSLEEAFDAIIVRSVAGIRTEYLE